MCEGHTLLQLPQSKHSPRKNCLPSPLPAPGIATKLMENDALQDKLNRASAPATRRDDPQCHARCGLLALKLIVN